MNGTRARDVILNRETIDVMSGCVGRRVGGQPFGCRRRWQGRGQQMVLMKRWIKKTGHIFMAITIDL